MDKDKTPAPKHTAEPWEAVDRATSIVGSSQMAGTVFVCDLIGPIEKRGANAARAVQCVNAMAGIENPDGVQRLMVAAHELLLEPTVFHVGGDKIVRLADALRAALTNLGLQDE